MPDDAAVADTLGWLSLKRNAYTRAIALLQEAADKLPDNAVVHYHLGMAYLKSGQADRARAQLTRALALDAGFPGAAEARAALASR